MAPSCPFSASRDARSLYIPRSSIEFAFDRLLEREGVPRERVQVPKVEKLDFTTIASLLAKPKDDADALDFADLETISSREPV